VFEVPAASNELFDSLLNTRDSFDGLWRATFAAQQGVYTYLQSLGGTKDFLIKAFRGGLFTIPSSSLALRAKHLLVRLSLTEQRLHRVVFCQPTLLSCTPARMDANIVSLTQLGFTSTQATDMVVTLPQLLNANWTTVLRQEKWHYISVTMRVPRGMIVQRPQFLMASVRGILLPRWEFLQRTASLRPTTHQELLNRMFRCISQSDMVFASRNNDTDHDLVYNDDFKQACLQALKP